MSKRATYGTVVKSLTHLAAACDRMRADNIDVQGPFENQFDRKPAWAVKLPGWWGYCYFATDGSGEMSGDNESPYYDERPFDTATGQLRETDDNGRPYSVHPDVRSGKVQAGDGGTGDFQLLRRLLAEYTFAEMEAAAYQNGGVLVERQVQASGEINFSFEFAEALA